MAYVYRHIRLDKNEPFYIGIGSDEEFKRAYVTKKRNKLWNSVISKTTYEVEILLDNLTWEQACNKEKEFIKLYGRKDTNTGILVNLTDGGDGSLGVVVSERGREIRRQNMKNRVQKPISEETKRKQSLIRKGKILTDEHKKNISIGLKGKQRKALTQEHKEKLKVANIGKKQSLTTIQKRVEKNKGQKRTAETIEKMRLARILYYKNKNQNND